MADQPAKTPLQILRDARELLSDEKRWTQGALGRDENGVLLCADQLDRAQCYCAFGGLLAAGDDATTGDFRALPLLIDAIDLQPDAGIGDWNDAPDRTHADVLTAFDRAIALAETGDYHSEQRGRSS